MLFVVAHVVHLENGTYAVRSPELPSCEARNAEAAVAREQFGDVLRERLMALIAAGVPPPLHSYEELAPGFAARCTVQIPAPDRRPGTFDRVIAVRAKLPPDAIERIALRPTPQRQPPPREPRPAAHRNDPARDTFAADDEIPAKLDPSARMAHIAARLAGRDRRAG
jgi:hypothetical protein